MTLCSLTSSAGASSGSPPPGWRPTPPWGTPGSGGGYPGPLRWVRDIWYWRGLWVGCKWYKYSQLQCQSESFILLPVGVFPEVWHPLDNPNPIFAGGGWEPLGDAADAQLLQLPELVEAEHDRGGGVGQGPDLGERGRAEHHPQSPQHDKATADSEHARINNSSDSPSPCSPSSPRGCLWSRLETLNVTDKAWRLLFGVICAVNIQPPTNQKKDLECLQILVKLTKIVQKVPI